MADARAELPSEPGLGLLSGLGHVRTLLIYLGLAFQTGFVALMCRIERRPLLHPVRHRHFIAILFIIVHRSPCYIGDAIVVVQEKKPRFQVPA